MLRYLILVFVLFPVLSFSQQWIKQDAGFSNDSMAVWNISLVDTQTVWVSSYNIYQGSQSIDIEFSKTNDSGENWTLGVYTNLPDSAHISYLHAVNFNTAWIALWGEYTLGNAIYKTIDGGENWTLQPSASFSDSGAFANVIHIYKVYQAIHLLP